MIIKNLLHASESYTHDNWVYNDVFVGFSRLYYIIDGEAYYEEDGKSVRFKKNHIYITPVKKRFSLYENPDNKLLHTYAHIITLPAANSFTEIEVVDDTPLADGIALWRKHINSGDTELLTNIIQFVLSCLTHDISTTDVARKTKKFIDSYEGNYLNMMTLSKELGYTREHITRTYVATYHITPNRYFKTRMMNSALERLVAGARVNEVPGYLNYSSPYSFSKAFKNYFGLSPKNYLLTLKASPRK